MTTIEMEYAISRRYDMRTHIMVPNISWGLLDHEADMLIVRQTGYCIEYEIKRSFSDFVKDFDKWKWKRDGRTLRNIKEFWYVFPEKLWLKRRDEITPIMPKFAGILIICKDDKGNLPWSKEIRSPVPDSNVKPLNAKQILKVASLGTMRIWNLKRQIITLKNEKARLNHSSRGSK